MAQCLDGGDAGGDRGVPVDRAQAGVAGVAAEPWVGVVLDGWAVAVLDEVPPVAGTEPDRRAGKVRPGLQVEQPADMVGVQMGADDVGETSRSTPRARARREAGRRSSRDGRRTSRRRWRSAGCCQRLQAMSQSRPEVRLPIQATGGSGRRPGAQRRTMRSSGRACGRLGYASPRNPNRPPSARPGSGKRPTRLGEDPGAS